MNNPNFSENRQGYNSAQDYNEQNKENINFFNYLGNPNAPNSSQQNQQQDGFNNENKEKLQPLNNEGEHKFKVEHDKFLETINKKYIENSFNVKNFVNMSNSTEMMNCQIPKGNNSKKSEITYVSKECSVQDKNAKEEELFAFVCNKENMPLAELSKRGVLMEIDSTSHSSYSFAPLNGNIYIPMYSLYTDRIPHDYMMDIWETLKLDEKLNTISYSCIIEQKDVNERMRAILIDWLVDVHRKFKLTDETMFLAVNIIDRYLSCKQVLRSRLQLIGVAALFIACKYEEIYCPDLRDFVYVTDQTYSKQELIASEKDLLLTLHFNVTVPSPLRFFEVIALNFNFNEVEFTYGRYLLQFFLVDCKINKYPSSLVSLAVAYIIMKMNNYPNYKDIYNLFNQNENLQSISNTKTLKECAKEIYYLVQNAESFDKLQAVFNKFSSLENYYVAIVGMGVNCVKKLEV